MQGMYQARSCGVTYSIGYRPCGCLFCLDYGLMSSNPFRFGLVLQEKISMTNGKTKSILVPMRHCSCVKVGVGVRVPVQVPSVAFHYTFCVCVCVFLFVFIFCWRD